MKCPICNKKVEDYENDIYYCYNCQILLKLTNYTLEHFKDVTNYEDIPYLIKEDKVEEIDLSKEETKDLNP